MVEGDTWEALAPANCEGIGCRIYPSALLTYTSSGYCKGGGERCHFNELKISFIVSKFILLWIDTALWKM